MVNHNWVNGNRATPTRFNDSAEQKLWRAVIGAAAEDAVTIAELNVKDHEDENYFLNPGRNFYTVCQYAGLDPEYVLRKMRKAIYDRKKGNLSPLQR